LRFAFWRIIHISNTTDFTFVCVFPMHIMSFKMTPPTPACCHLFVVGGLRTSMTRIAMLAEVYSLGRVTQARQIEG